MAASSTSHESKHAPVAEKLPADKYPGDREFTVPHITPFGARLDIKIIKSHKLISPARDGYLEGNDTKYIPFVT
ncbi:hypothetical protein DER46DRAFT_357569 [Fusarium sp. MPI-SDFR-AT-0072]|uniref:Uncharacterized protein n=1 Tax=Fusarium oxysporum f. sp. rapae TaxID=485398 RepID=A0A8J5NLA3_FUSOX|nr:hypothetical protein Forpe1208_v013556 [Fusarium oxysporum f. sp. rapae]KAH7158312.1 hypothetical protein DER46DRAFT_357569 [Fusarium sp. MPI-SDFR-AT-0072]